MPVLVDEAAGTAAPPAPRPTPLRVRIRRKAFLLALVPTGVFLVALVAYPLGTTILESFYAYSLVSQQVPQFVGLRNYVEVLTGESFAPTLLRTVVWTAGSVLLKTAVGLAFAVLLRDPFRGNALYRMLLLIPWATPQVIGAVVWKWVYDGQFGHLNYILVGLGLTDERISFLASPISAFVSVLLVDVWFGIPFMAFVFLAGLSGIPDTLYESARVDGASAMQRFRHITMPLLLPVFAVATSLSVIWTFNSFNIIETMTGGGPVGGTEILVTKAYHEAFGEFDIGVATTYATIIFLILLVFTVTYWAVLRRRGEVR